MCYQADKTFVNHNRPLLFNFANTFQQILKAFLRSWFNRLCQARRYHAGNLLEACPVHGLRWLGSGCFSPGQFTGNLCVSSATLYRTSILSIYIEDFANQGRTGSYNASLVI